MVKSRVNRMLFRLAALLAASAALQPRPRAIPLTAARNKPLAERTVVTDLGGNRSCFVYEVADRSWWRSPPNNNPYGAKVWPGALAAVSRVEGLARGRSVLEIGSGNGLVSLSCAKHFAPARVRASDVSPLALDLAKRAAKAQRLAVECERFDVLSADPLPDGFDVLVAADLLYDEALAIGVAARVLEAHTRGMDVVVGGSPDREGRAAFLDALRRTLPDVAFEPAYAVAHPGLKWKGKNVEVFHLPP